MPQDFTVDRASKKYVLGSDGFLKEYANDEPAIEFNADGSYKGVLVEPASTNLIPHSEDISNPEWDDTDVTITTNQVIAPDGTLTADKVNFSASNNARIAELITTSAGTYTFSFWIRTVTGTGNFRMAFFTAGKSANTSTFSVSEQWKRVSITYSHDATNSLLCYLGYYISTAYVQEVYFWGAQLEESPIATSYIPTNGSTVTRLKDDIYLTSASSLIGQTEGTIYAEVDWQDSGANQVLLEINDSTSNNRVNIYKLNSPAELRMFARANSVDLTNQGESSTAYSGIQKIAFAYKTDDFELFRNGSSISTDTSGSLASLGTLTDIGFGNRDTGGGSGLEANMWIRAVALFTTRLSDPECEALTTI